MRTMRTKTMACWMLLGLFALAGASWAARGDDKERKSKNGKLEATVGGAQVVVEYGRPNAAGRKIFGALVPWGEIWRAGADEATTISFDKDVTIEGQAFGRRSLRALPDPRRRGVDGDLQQGGGAVGRLQVRRGE